MAAAPPFAGSAAEDEPVFKLRLLTRTSVTRGDPPLRKLIRKLAALADAAPTAQPDAADAAARLLRAFLQDLAAFELLLLKSHAVVAANRREQDSFRHLQAALARDSAQAEVDIEQLQKDLEVAKVERQHEEECEVVRKLIAAQPSRRATQKATEELEREIAGLERENTALQLTLDQRKKHFAVLFGVVDDLQAVLEDETGSSFGLDASLPSLGTGSLVLSDLQPPAFLGGATGGATAAAGRTANELRVLER